MSRRCAMVVGVLSFLLSVVAGNAWAAVLYTVTDLGTLGGVYALPHDINAQGQVAGTSSLANSTRHAFLYSGGTMTDLGTLGGSGSAAWGINADGQVAGDFGTTSGSRAFLYSNGQMTKLQLPGDPTSYARGINASEQVVGCAAGHPLLYSNGTTTILLAGNGDAQAINANGQVVGVVEFGSSHDHHAFLYSSGTMTDLGTFGGSDSSASDINDSGWVVGRADLPGGVWDYHAFLYRDGEMSDLGTLGGIYSSALGINNDGLVVGWAFTSGDEQRAFLYREGRMADLNDLIEPVPGWTLKGAAAINDGGWIAGYGANAAGETHAFLLTPIPEPPTLVIWSLLGALGMAGGWYRRRKTA